jgi:hypothetical protein
VSSPKKNWHISAGLNQTILVQKKLPHPIFFPALTERHVLNLGCLAKIGQMSVIVKETKDHSTGVLGKWGNFYGAPGR